MLHDDRSSWWNPTGLREAGRRLPTAIPASLRCRGAVSTPPRVETAEEVKRSTRGIANIYPVTNRQRPRADAAAADQRDAERLAWSGRRLARLDRVAALGAGRPSPAGIGTASAVPTARAKAAARRGPEKTSSTQRRPAAAASFF